MARLSEILGGILKDVTQSRVTADLQTRDLYDAYRAHPLLARMPIPRVTVQALNLRLRFAIAEHEEPDYGKLDLTEAANAWTERLRATVLPRAYGKAAPARTRPADQLIRQAGSSLVASPRSLSLSRALGGDVEALVAASVKLVAGTRARMPAAKRRAVPSAALRAEATKEVRREVMAFLPQIRRQLAAAAAAETDLSVLVRDKDLARVDESRIHEITLTLTSDDIQLAAQLTPGTEGEEPGHAD